MLLRPYWYLYSLCGWTVVIYDLLLYDRIAEFSLSDIGEIMAWMFMKFFVGGTVSIGAFVITELTFRGISRLTGQEISN